MANQVHGLPPASNPLRLPHKVAREEHHIDPLQPDWRVTRLARRHHVSTAAAAVILTAMTAEVGHAL